MNAYLAYLKVNLRLTWRERTVLVFNYIFPLMFFFLFAESGRADQSGGAIKQIFAGIVVLGIIGNGFFGGGIRAVIEREQNILRRFKVAPITPLPLIFSSATVGLIMYLPSALIVFAISNLRYGLAVPPEWLSALVLIAVGTIAFRAMGQIIASVANSMAEYQVIAQTLYFPMLLLSGATFPISVLPQWVQVLSQFIPSTYLVSGIQNILIRGESLADNATAVSGLLITTALSTFIAIKLFRWEKGEKVKATAKLWLVAALLPFLIAGAFEARGRTNLAKAKAVAREVRRSRSILFENVRVISGGQMIPQAGVLVRDGKIAQIFPGQTPEAKSLRADPVEAAGKTLLSGLIDADVAIAMPPGGAAAGEIWSIERALAAYLFSGVTAVGSIDEPAQVEAVSRRIADGELLGAETIHRPAVPRPRSVAELEALIQDNPPRAISGALLAEPVPPGLFQRMKAASVAYLPSVADVEARLGRPDQLERSLVQQVGPAALLTRVRQSLAAHPPRDPASLALAIENLRRAQAAEVKLLAGGGGRGALWPGPGIHRELQLWVEAGLTPEFALRAATVENAAWLGVAGRLGDIRPGQQATLLLLNGNPAQDIRFTESISLLVFRGERVDRGGLFKQNEND